MFVTPQRSMPQPAMSRNHLPAKPAPQNSPAENPAAGSGSLLSPENFGVNIWQVNTRYPVERAAVPENPTGMARVKAGQFQREWQLAEHSTVQARVDAFLKTGCTLADAESMVKDLTGTTGRYKNENEALLHLSHMKSWTGVVKFAPFHWRRTEGWFMDKYPQVKMLSLAKSLAKVKAMSNDEAVQRFGESKPVVMTKIGNEIWSQANTYYTQKHQQDLFKMGFHPVTEQMIKDEAINYCDQISKLQPGQEFAIASGFPGHAMYIGVRRQPDQHATLAIYNLGGRARSHPVDANGRIAPFVVKDIPLNAFKTRNAGVVNYFSGILTEKIGANKDKDKDLIYDPAQVSQLGGRVMPVNNGRPAQKPQVAGNCVVKNNNVAQRNRAQNDKLFSWLKEEETQWALSNVPKNPKEYQVKENQKSNVDVQFIALIHQGAIHGQKPPIATTIYNLNRFLEKRIPAPDHISDKNERLAYFFNAVKSNREMTSWFKTPQAQSMLIEVITTTSNAHLRDALDPFILRK